MTQLHAFRTSIPGAPGGAVLITCPHCRGSFPDPHPIRPPHHALCPHCGLPFTITDALLSLPPLVSTPRPPVAMPGHVQLRHGPAGLSISWPWRSPFALALALVCLPLGAVALGWLGLALRGSPAALNPVLLLLSLLGLGLGYVLLAELLNRTVVEVEAGRLAVRHGPLPWPAPPVLRGEALWQLYTRVHTSGRPGRRRTLSYQIWALGRGGSATLVIGSLRTLDQALYLEQQIEAALGIADTAVRGEVPRQ